MINSIFPRVTLGAFCCIFSLKRIRPKAPANPSNIPKLLIHVIRSFIKIADRINTKIGVMVAITELLMGVERLNPLKNINILITIPKTAQINNLGQSLDLIFSLGPKKLISQNNAAAPLTRSMINPKGSMCVGITSLATV